MIAGIGTDLVNVARMRDMLARYGSRLAGHLLHPDELASYVASANPAAFLAKRFAAKEALAKGLGTGLRAPVTLRAMAVGHDAIGRPYFKYAPALQALIDQRSVSVHLSVTDEHDHAMAFVVVETVVEHGAGNDGTT